MTGQDRDPQESMEMIQARWRGDRGAKGDKGDTGAAGLGITPGAKKAGIFLLILTLLIGSLSVLFTAREVNQLRAVVLTHCKWDADLGPAPVTVSSATGKPSLLGVKIISDARTEWHGLGCPGRLSAPAPSFRHWADIYHLPVG